MISDLPYQHPFELRVLFPSEIGYGLGLTPHLLYKPLTMVADVSKKYAHGKDVIVVRNSEIDQMTRLTAATGAVNNVIAVANRILSLRVEDVSVPLKQTREVERLLTSIVREGTNIVNKLVAKNHVLTMSFMRRDAMMRGGVEPNTNTTLFAAPWSRNHNYPRTIDEQKYEEWVTETGAKTQARQTRIIDRWRQVKQKRDAWWAQQERQRVGHHVAYAGELPTIGTPVVKPVDVEAHAERLQKLEDLPDLE